jgi:hypothetical protein
LAIEKLKSHKSPGNSEIPTELIKAWGRNFPYDIYIYIYIYICILIISIWKKEELPEE